MSLSFLEKVLCICAVKAAWRHCANDPTYSTP